MDAVLIVTGVALFVAPPLGDSVLARRRVARAKRPRPSAWGMSGGCASGLRELEFDREMGKLGDTDLDRNPHCPLA